MKPLLASAYHRPGAVDDGAVLEAKPQLEVGLLGPGCGVLPADMKPPRGEGDRFHHQALRGVRLNCMGGDRDAPSHCVTLLLCHVDSWVGRQGDRHSLMACMVTSRRRKLEPSGFTSVMFNR